MSTTRYRFNSVLPRLLSTGAVTFGNRVYVRRHYIRREHRAHEEYHAAESRRLGTIPHLARFVWWFLRGVGKHGFKRITAHGRSYLRAYWLHPEEVAARAYGAAHAHEYTDLGVP